MAKSDNNLFDKVRGSIGKMVIKQYKNKTVITSYPDMSKIQASKSQKNRRKLFTEAVAYAQKIIRDPELKKKYEPIARKKNKTVYHLAMQEFYFKNAPTKRQMNMPDLNFFQVE
jgi:hypothetical protein